VSVRSIRILCVDDHSFLVSGLESRIALERDLEFVGSMSSAASLLSTVRELQPDVILLDIEMPGPDPFEVAHDVAKSHAKTKIIFLSAHVRDHYIRPAILAGAWAYFAKSDEPTAILDGIRKVHTGAFAFGPKVEERIQSNGAPSRSARVTPPSTRLDALSPREQEVLRLIGRGMSRSEIADALSRSPKTVDGHRESIMAKLDIHDRAELIRFALREGVSEL